MTALSRADRHELRARHRAQRDRLRAQMKERVAAVKSEPRVKAALEQRKRRRQKQVAAVLIAILILLLLQLDCEGGPGAPPVAAVAEQPEAPPPEVKKPKTKRKPKAKLDGNLEGSDRDGMAIEPLPPPSWLGAFRLQVAARSPRLASCFNGVEKPGALRWSALVHAQSGTVTESVVEPVFRGTGLTDAQLACLVKGLTDPPFELKEPDPDAAARRVSLIFEF